ncbi:hypothetical protein [Roseococcus pinisoli]|uniref:Arrestin-like N-terminal domain-containing protein n=1 Tax=Roseococcus pinisoli TaxID=2835040 RepID=A0ABS5Q9R2_9PROT|nr:hypothetical protein [Roseococcus pinisoli]MBS7810173.1 hypothetical protein [Roseococcus pinisoli]
MAASTCIRKYKCLRHPLFFKKENIYYRLLRLEARPDGSILIIIDRQPSLKSGGLTLRHGNIEIDPEKVGEIVHHGKFTCHVTGQVNYYKNGTSKPHITYIDPLYKLTEFSVIGFYSVPCISRLDKYYEKIDKTNILPIMVPPTHTGRFSFRFSLSPNENIKNSDSLIVKYELYSLVIEPINIEIPAEMAGHFVVGNIDSGKYNNRQVNIDHAELEFHKRILKGAPPIYREAAGSYIVFAEVPMRIPPKLTVKFDHPSLSAEQISIEGNTPNVHKIRFWIRDAGGRNKKDDLRRHIISVELDAEM